jgi:hypothetical protein
VAAVPYETSVPLRPTSRHDSTMPAPDGYDAVFRGGLRGEVGGAIVQRLRTQRADRVVVARRGGADDPDPGVPGQLDQGRADTAVGAEDEDRAAPADPRHAVQHLPGGDAVDHDRLGGGGVDAVGDTDQVGGSDEDRGGPAADLGDGRDAGADQRGVRAGADLDDPADQVVAGDERERRLVVVLAAAHLLLGERHAAGLHLDQGLARAGRGQFAFPDDEAIGLDDAGQDDLGGDARVHEGSSFRGWACFASE